MSVLQPIFLCGGGAVIDNIGSLHGAYMALYRSSSPEHNNTTQNSQNDRIEEVKYKCEYDYDYDYEYPGHLDQTGGFHNWWNFF